MNNQFSKKILVCMLVFLFIFVQEILFITYKTSVEPSVLITSVFAFCGIEGGLMAWIKTTKTKENNKECSNDDESDDDRTFN